MKLNQNLFCLPITADCWIKMKCTHTKLAIRWINLNLDECNTALVVLEMKRCGMCSQSSQRPPTHLLLVTFSAQLDNGPLKGFVFTPRQRCQVKEDVFSCQKPSVQRAIDSIATPKMGHTLFFCLFLIDLTPQVWWIFFWILWYVSKPQ